MTTLDDPPLSPAKGRYRGFARGDLNAFFGLMLDNVGDMILMSALLVLAFGFPRGFVIGKMIPGTAVGVLVGDLIFTALAFRLARRTGREVTAMPLGLDTPSTFGSVFLVLGPAFLAAKSRGLPPEDAARHAWYVGIAMILASGLFKILCSFASGWVRRVVPRAGLLGSLVSIALVIISFLPLVDVAARPVAGFVSLAIILATLTAGWGLPRKLPGALVAVLVGCAAMGLVNLGHLGLNRWAGADLPISWSDGARPSASFRATLPLPIFDWWRWFQVHWRDAVSFLPVAIPLALATVVGGIDCAESASAAGDDYPTGPIVGVDALATLAGGLFGGVIQSTPYIGHPAYKAMGARAGYTLATALFVGVGRRVRLLRLDLLPPAQGRSCSRSSIFVGLEITAQFLRAPRRAQPLPGRSPSPASRLAGLPRPCWPSNHVLAPRPSAVRQVLARIHPAAGSRP